MTPKPFELAFVVPDAEMQESTHSYHVFSIYMAGSFHANSGPNFS